MAALRIGDCCGSQPFALPESFNSLLLRQTILLPRRCRTQSTWRSSSEKAPLLCTAQSLGHRATALATAEHACHRRLQLGLQVGSEVLPHPGKVEKGGEDAFFVSNYNGGVLGVADGVSGWAEENVDPALFAREFMEHASAAVGSEEINNCPRQLLAKAEKATSSIGAATVILAILERDEAILRIANVGDCGLRLARKGKIVFATSTQQHYFDCPYQFSSEAGAQTSDDAMVYCVKVMEGDTIIMGSDGLFDNVYDKDIETTLNLFDGCDKDSAQQAATALASLAHKHAVDLKYQSPYSREAALQGYDLPFWRKLLGQKLTGGKLDDITVLIAHVVDADTLPRDKEVSYTSDTSITEQKKERLESSPEELVAQFVDADRDKANSCTGEGTLLDQKKDQVESLSEQIACVVDADRSPREKEQSSTSEDPLLAQKKDKLHSLSEDLTAHVVDADPPPRDKGQSSTIENPLLDQKADKLEPHSEEPIAHVMDSNASPGDKTQSSTSKVSQNSQNGQ